jgi:drug/metabolite transporter (DMT)-like permease
MRSGEVPVTSSARIGIIAATGAALLWGSGTVASAAVLDRGIPGGPFTLVELVTSVAFLAVIARCTATPLPSMRRLWKAGALGLLEPGLTYVLVNAGLARTSLTHAVLIQAVEPVLIAGLGWLLLRNVLPIRILIPMITVLAGSVVVVVTAHTSTRGVTLVGDVLVALGVLCAATYVLGSSRIDRSASALGVILLQQVFALCLVAPLVGVTLIAGGGFRVVLDGATTPWLWLAVPFIGIGVFSLTFWLFLIALRHIPAATAAQFLSISTVVGFIGAVALLDERMSLQAAAGAVVVVVSLVAIARGEQRASHPVIEGT